MEVEFLPDGQADVLGARHHPGELLQFLVLFSHEIPLQLQDASVVLVVFVDVHAVALPGIYVCRGCQRGCRWTVHGEREIVRPRPKLPQHVLATTRLALRHDRVGEVRPERVELGGEGVSLSHHRRREPGGLGAASEGGAAVPLSDGGERVVDQLLSLLEPSEPPVVHGGNAKS